MNIEKSPFVGNRSLLVVLGAGESGVGTAILGKQKGYEVFVSDQGLIAEKYKEVLLNNDILFEEGKHTESKIMEADLVMKSPGIPEKVKIYQRSYCGNHRLKRENHHNHVG
jgi:UDP-N-acetylmuramoylalanine--D-glutamate ligase